MSKPVWLSFAVTSGLLVGALVVGGMTERRIPESLAVPLDRINSQISGWREINQRQLDARTLRVLDPTTYLARTYQKGTSQLDLFIAYYAQQRAGESMHSPQHCLPGAGWEIMQRGSATVSVMGRHVQINKYKIQNLGARMLMLYWYQSRNRIVASEYTGKVLLARDTLLSGLTGGSIVRIILTDDQAASAQGVAFASDVIPQVQRCLGYNGQSTLSR